MRFSSLKLLLLLLSVGFFLCACGEQESGRSLVSAPTGNGQPAPDFSLTDLQGNKVSLDDYKGQVVLLNFWATWCPPCREEMPSMEQLYRGYREKGLVILAVNVEENGVEVVNRFLQSTPYSFPILIDEQAAVQNLYKVFRFPETFIIDRNGIIVEKVIGAVDWTSGPVFKLINFLISS